MAVKLLIENFSEREKKIIYKPEPSRASTEQSGTAPKRIRTEPERNRAEPSRSGAGPKLSASERSRAGRHAEGARKAKPPVLAHFSDFVSSHARSEPSRRRTASRSSWIGLGSTRIGSGAIGSGWVWIGCTIFLGSESARTRRRN